MSVVSLESALNACYKTIAEARLINEKLEHVMQYLVQRAFSEQESLSQSLGQESRTKIRSIVAARIEEPLRQAYVEILTEIYKESLADFTINDLKKITQNPKGAPENFESHLKLRQKEEWLIKNNVDSKITQALKEFGNNLIREQTLQYAISDIARRERIGWFRTTATQVEKEKSLTFGEVLKKGDINEIKKAILLIDPELHIPDNVKNLIDLLEYFVQEENFNWLRTICEEFRSSFVKIRGGPCSEFYYDRDEFIFCALIAAVKKGKVDVLAFLSQQMKANIHVKSDKFEEGTLLHYAAKAGQLEAVKYLLHILRLDPSSRVQAGRYDVLTPLNCAIDNKHWEVAKYLVSAGADCKFGLVPNLKIATRSGNIEFVKLIFKETDNLFGVPPCIKSEIIEDCLEIAKENKDEKLISFWDSLNIPIQSEILAEKRKQEILAEKIKQEWVPPMEELE